MAVLDQPALWRQHTGRLHLIDSQLVLCGPSRPRMLRCSVVPGHATDALLCCVAELCAEDKVGV